MAGLHSRVAHCFVHAKFAKRRRLSRAVAAQELLVKDGMMEVVVLCRRELLLWHCCKRVGDAAEISSQCEISANYVPPKDESGLELLEREDRFAALMGCEVVPN